eukprot:3941467-Rhodomonas_salina.2
MGTPAYATSVNILDANTAGTFGSKNLLKNPALAALCCAATTALLLRYVRTAHNSPVPRVVLQYGRSSSSHQGGRLRGETEKENCSSKEEGRLKSS